MKTSFGSDNHAPVHPLVMEAIQRCNVGYERSYGDDCFTERATQMIQNIFDPLAPVHFVLNGTAANVLSLVPMLRPHQSILSAATAHINVDECGAPERYLGSKIQTVQTSDGKLTPALLKHFLQERGNQHAVQPGVVSISQTTELGTVYTPQEIRELADFAHANDMLLHMDGARFANAVAALQCAPTACTKEAGVDVFSLGGTKNGLMFGEAVVFLNHELGQGFPFIRKQGMQLLSKMRYVSAQFESYLHDDLWLRNAQDANDMAVLLETELASIPDFQIVYPRQANAVFAHIPGEWAEKLLQHTFFYYWDEHVPIIRLMTSWSTTRDEVFSFVKTVREVCVHDEV